MNQDTYNHIGLFNWGFVGHGSVELVTERHNHNLFQDAVSIHELFGGTGNVSVVVQDPHSIESSDLYLQSEMGADIWVELHLLELQDASGCSGGEG